MLINPLVVQSQKKSYIKVKQNRSEWHHYDEGMVLPL